MNLELNKCKEYFIDCVNIRTFDYIILCDNENTVMKFIKADYISREMTCDIQVINLSISMTKSFPCVSIPYLERETLYFPVHIDLIHLIQLLKISTKTFFFKMPQT